MNAISESEKKRLQSLKEKKQAFRAKEQFIRQALSNLNNDGLNKKIIFDDDFGEQEIPKPKHKTKKDLFDNDNDNNNENSLWKEEEFNAKKNKKITLGNDARFTLDDRFIEDNRDKETKNIERIDECDLQKEKKKQLDILESILGVPFSRKNQEAKTAKQRLMIRYDPTENKHSEYEIKPTQSDTQEKSTKKRKREKIIPEIEEPIPVEVSKDIYYTVSDTLTESLKQKEGFSLLKAYGREKIETNTSDHDTSIVQNNKDHKFKSNFTLRDAFKYDSSDNEDTEEALDANKQRVDQIKNNHTNSLFGYKNTLFFDSNDVRFNEAVKFFSTEAVPNENFKNLRRELKMIVRTKIRKNERRQQLWGKKKRIKRS